jgi:acyl transferase domain-containing protein/acyl-CoA synthetase (AMP-forming)/AMP-acid ligase II
MNDHPDAASVVDLLARRAREYPQRRAYILLNEAAEQAEALTYEQLDRRARQVAARLVDYEPGSRALLMVPHALDFLVGFFGCLYADVIAVPLPSPETAQLKRSLPRLQSAAADAAPSLIISARANAEQVLLACREVAALGSSDHLVLGRDDRGGPLGHRRHGGAADIAYLQYTSGSTAAPKGVMVTHANVLRQSAVLDEAWPLGPGDACVSWMPYFHDFGLLAGLIHPLYAAVPSYLMTPTTFLRSPASWLRAISVFGATHSSAPVFAYDYCVKRVTDRQLEGLDLSRWRVAGIGAERVQARTLAAFAERFAAAGLREEVFYPGYGLAEYTLMATSRRPGTAVTVLPPRTAAQGSGEPGSYASPWPLVGCGHPVADTQVLIVDPETRLACPADTVGEIWLGGASTARGYWNRARQSAETFQARLADDRHSGGPAAADDQRTFLRTGDLGLLHHGELLVTGRLKELIIVQGVNHYPEDIERAVLEGSPGFEGLRGAAFAVDAGGTEGVVVVQETRTWPRSPAQLSHLVADLRRAVSENCGVDLHAFALVRRGSLPKTTSGKVQRRACRDEWLAGTLKTVGQWRKPRAAPAGPAATSASPPALTGEDLRSWLAATVAELAGAAPASIDAAEPFASHGLDSAGAAHLASKLTELLGTPVDSAAIYEYPTIAALADHLTAAKSRDASIGQPPASSRIARSSSAARQFDGAGPGVQPPGLQDNPVAIVGMACRYPGGVESPEDLWRLLEAGVDAVGPLPLDRGWEIAVPGSDQPGAGGRLAARAGGFLYDAPDFDASFFGIAPREAAAMSPQQRIALEISWEALERARLDPTRLRGSDTGVFLGVMPDNYALVPGAQSASAEGYLGTGSAPSVTSGRVCYALGLQGPAITVDTACSSALVAVHLAVRSLRAGECSLALAGGVAVMSTPDVIVEFSRRGGLSPDGRCRSFSQDANGTGWAEGGGVVLLERLPDAIASGHPVLAIVRGSAVNSDGATNGLAAPSGQAQQKVIRRALADAGLRPEDIDALEAHGTGTRLGDPIEANAVAAAYGADRARPLWMGSVKSNIGHAQAAAGAAGLIKMVQAMRQGVLPRSLHLDRPSSAVDWSASSIRLLRQPEAWPGTGRPRRAAVSAFGISGTNAHVILELAADSGEGARLRPAAPEHGSEEAGKGGAAEAGTILPWVVSARDPGALRGQARRLRDYVSSQPEASLVRVGRALACSRTAFTRRAVVLAADRDGYLRGLQAVAQGQPDPGVVLGERVKGQLAAVFSGQGSQRPGMGREMHRRFPVYAQAFDDVCAELDNHLDLPLRDAMFADDLASADLLGETRYAQPALLAVQVAQFRLLQDWGIRPAVVAGHSLGEVVAAHVAGVLDLPDAAAFVCARGRLMQELTEPGLMAVLRGSEQEAASFLADIGCAGTGSVSIAAVNGSRSVVISGPPAAVEDCMAAWRRRAGRARLLRGTRAFHSPLMTPVLEELTAIAERLTWHEPTLPMVSMLTGQHVRAGQVSHAGYWAEQVVRPVQFARAVATLTDSGTSSFIEVGPDAVLTPMGAAATPAGSSVTWIPLAHPRRGEAAAFISGAAALFARGAAVRWSALFPDVPGADLPTYAFQRRRYWPVQLPAVRPSGTPGQGRASASWSYQVAWEPLPIAPSPLTGAWLVVGTGDAGLPAALSAAGATVLRAAPDAVAEDADCQLQLDRLFREHGLPPASLSGVLLRPAGPGAANQVMGLLRWLRRSGTGARMWVLTQGAVCVSAGDEPPDPEQAMLWGLGRVAALESPRTWGGLADLPDCMDAGVATRLISAVGAAPESGEDQLAFRGAATLGRRLDRASAGPPDQDWHPAETIMITGGTGALGSQLARWLAAHGAAHLVLLSRRGRDSPGAAELAAEIQARGARVTLLAADVTDQAAMAEALATVARQGCTAGLHHHPGVSPGRRAGPGEAGRSHCRRDGCCRASQDRRGPCALRGSRPVGRHLARHVLLSGRSLGRWGPGLLRRGQRLPGCIRRALPRRRHPGNLRRLGAVAGHRDGSRRGRRAGDRAGPAAHGSRCRPGRASADPGPAEATCDRGGHRLGALRGGLYRAPAQPAAGPSSAPAGRAQSSGGSSGPWLARARDRPARGRAAAGHPPGCR